MQAAFFAPRARWKKYICFRVIVAAVRIPESRWRRVFSNIYNLFTGGLLSVDISQALLYQTNGSAGGDAEEYSSDCLRRTAMPAPFPVLISFLNFLLPTTMPQFKWRTAALSILFGYSSKIAAASSGFDIRSASVTLSKKSFISSLSFIHMGSVLHLPERSQ